MGPIRVRTACQKCRVLKHKCDFNYPKCSRCERTGSECYVQDPKTKEYKPRWNFGNLVKKDLRCRVPLESSNSLEYLEKRIRSLESKLGSYEKVLLYLGINAEDDSHLSLSMSQINILSMIPFKGSSYSHQEPTNSSIFGRWDQKTEQNYPPATLPEKQEDCNFIISNYYRFAWIQQPIVENQQILFSISQYHYAMKSKSSLPSWDAFLLFICLAIGSAVTGDSTTTVKKYYFTSIFHLKKFLYSIPVILQNYDDGALSLQLQARSLQALLLICSFGLMQPVSPGIWYIIASAMRLCIDLDLHNESTLLKLDSQNSSEKGFYRRLFWSCYALDIQICCYVNKPFSLAASDITAKKINSTNDNISLVISHLSIQIRSMQSLIHQFVYRSYNLGASSAEEWRHEMHLELNSWLVEVLRYLENPNPEVQKIMPFSQNIFILTYLQQLDTLYRPTAAHARHLSTEEFQILYECATKIISIYETLHLSGTINFKYLSVYSIHQCGLTFIYCLTNSPDSSTLQRKILKDCKEFVSKVTVLMDSLKVDCPPAESIGRKLVDLSESAMDTVTKRSSKSKVVEEDSPTVCPDSFGPFDREIQQKLKEVGAIPLTPNIDRGSAPASTEQISSQDPLGLLLNDPLTLRELMMIE